MTFRDKDTQAKANFISKVKQSSYPIYQFTRQNLLLKHNLVIQINYNDQPVERSALFVTFVLSLSCKV